MAGQEKEEERGRGTEGKERISRPTILLDDHHERQHLTTAEQHEGTNLSRSEGAEGGVCVANCCSSHSPYISVVRGKDASLIRVFYRVNGCFTSCSPNVQFKVVLSEYLAPVLITLAAPSAINLVCNHT